MFENMTNAQWLTAVHAKVKVSWNLHKVLPKEMDFFISLSSLSGIYGSPGQSNYAAGCSFQDALARHRTLTGYRGSVTFDLGWMSTIGIVSESQDLRRYQQNARIMQQVNDTDLFATLDHYCNPSLAPIDAEHTQVLIGVFTHGNFHLRGETPSAYLDRPLFAAFNAPHLWATRTSSFQANGSAQASTSMLFRQAGTIRERSAIVVAAIRAKLARSLGIEIGDVDPRGKPSDYGTDSLMAVELRNWIRNDFGVLIAVFDITGGNDILLISKLVAERAEY